MISIRRAAALLMEDGRGIARATLLVAIIRVALWWVPFRVIHAYLQRKKRRVIATYAHRSATVPVAHVVRRVQRGSRIVPQATCLVQALAAEQLLARAGHNVTLRVGVARVAMPGDPKLEAHAWLEYRGMVVLGGAGYDRFTPLPPLPPLE